MSIKAVDLFCGVGGLTHGLQLAGLNVVAGIDIDASCKYSYEVNNNAKFIESDVSQIPSKIIKDYLDKSEVRVLVGCAPCQPFSKYTHRYRKEGRVGNKWKLLYAFADKICDVRPHIVSMENVPQLENDAVFYEFLQVLKDLGYYSSHSIVYCPDYGVPQSRKRLVLLASMYGDIKIIDPMFRPDEYLTVKDAISSLPPIEAGGSLEADSLHHSAKLSDVNICRIQASKPGGTWRDWDDSLKLQCHGKKSGKTYASVYGRMSWDKPSPTITTQFYGYGNGRFGHPEQNRALSIREGAILQSFPPNYKFVPENHPIKMQDVGMKIGNAVPVELGRAIGLSILDHLQEVYDGEDNKLAKGSS